MLIKPMFKYKFAIYNMYDKLLILIEVYFRLMINYIYKTVA